MALVPHKIVALNELNEGEKNTIAGAVVSLYDTDGNAVTLFDDESGSNGSTAKQTDSEGVVVVYVTPGEYDEQVNGGIQRRVLVGNKEITTEQLIERIRKARDGDVITTTGFSSAGDGGSGSWVATSTTGLTASQTPADRGSAELVDGSGRLWRYTGIAGTAKREISVHALGALGLSDDTAAIQAALNEGGVITSRGVTHQVTRAATDSYSGRGYCLSAGSDTTIDFDGSTISNLATLNDTDILITQGGNTYENITVKNLTIDGQAVSNDNTKKGFCLWFRGVTGLRFENICTVNSRSWGIRVQDCDRVKLNGTDSLHGSNINADGIHFIDTSNVVGSNINIYTEGDDGFIIEALYSDVENYNITSLNVEANVQVASAGRGIFIFQEEDINPAILGMKNIRINGVVKNCKGGAFVTAGSLDILNMDIDISSDACEYGMYLQYGSSASTNQGSIKTSRFKGLISNTTKNGFFMNPLNGSVAEMCDFNVRVYNPADGFTGATIKGQEHTGSFVVDYDPLSDKVSHSNGVQLDATDCDLYVMCKGANNNLNFADNAQRNNIRIGNLKNAVTSDVSASSSVNCFENKVYGGSITTLTQNGALRNRFYHTKGATFESRDSLAPDGSGAVSVAHGLPAAPRRTMVTAESNTVMANVVSTDANNINLEIRGFGGSLVTSGSYRVNIQTQVDF